MLFKLQGRLWVCSHVWVCPRLFPWTKQGKAPNKIAGWTSRAQSLGLLETRKSFLSYPMRWKCHCGSQENGWNGHALTLVSNTPESDFVAVFQKGMKCKLGKSNYERKRKKWYWLGQEGFQRPVVFQKMGGGGFQRLGQGFSPQGVVIAFPLGRTWSSQEKWLLQYYVISQHWAPSNHSSTSLSLSSLPLQTLLVQLQSMLPSLCPRQR